MNVNLTNSLHDSLLCLIGSAPFLEHFNPLSSPSRAGVCVQGCESGLVAQTGVHNLLVAEV